MGGKTYEFKIHSRKEYDNFDRGIPIKIVIKLSKNILINYFTSIELAHKYLDRQRYLVGPLRKRKKLLVDVTQ